MSPTDHYRVIPQLTVPDYASATLRGIVSATHAAIQANVDNLGAGTPSKAPKFIKMLRDHNLIDENDHSTTTDDHNDAVKSLNKIKSRLQDNDEGVDTSTYGTYSAAGSAYNDIDDAVTRLRNTLSDAVRTHKPRRNPNTDTVYWPESVEGPLRRACATAATDVEDCIRTAGNDIRRYAEHITGSLPDNPTAGGYGGVTTAMTTAWVGHNYVPPTDASTLQKIEGFARNELGVTEGPGNHVDRPYNIDDAWCSSFATWVWKKSRISVPWTNKNYVPSVWSDAVNHNPPLADNISGARAGDLLIFGGQNHIGVIVARNGNSITTIEGSSGDAVREHTYDLSSNKFTGVVHPPAESRVTVDA